MCLGNQIVFADLSINQREYLGTSGIRNPANFSLTYDPACRQAGYDLFTRRSHF